MPSSSKSQQRFFGVVKAMQKGDKAKEGEAGKVAKSMDKDDVDDFASTKHKGLPNKVKRESRVKSLIRKMVREIMAESTVRISTMKDVSFAGRDRLALYGKKGKVGLDRKSVSALVKAVRNVLGRSFTAHEVKEGKLNEAKMVTLPNGVKVKIEFKGITLQAKGKKPVFLDRREMMTFFKATQKYMKQGLNAGKVKEGFAGGLPKSKRKAFDNVRRKQSEVLGYKLTGKDDMKVETDDATVHEAKNKGLWANIHAKRKRGESPAEPGDKDYPKTLDIEGKIKEDYKNNEWEVYLRDEKGREKIVKKAKSKRAATILYNRIIKSDDYYEVGMRAIKEGKLTEAKETIFDVAARVINDKQAYKYKSRRGQVLVDMQSANLLVKVFKKVNTKMKKILSDLGEKNPAQLMNTLWAVVK